ncbi:Sec-independent protein translocase protein TatB [Roseateles amylovorans]|uniref:Sec-independent protein translocase protein TatB n=1 Tax=Roseateles amylovorans TaxID=2978473 RepID=A0ABY6B3G8_9BURK|nr:Sec-independent protein translocase protein TatB [Roseateles amylovorans]UXH79734.1 Sec-independent protein translocase protein TatB [Roseateles amylovorans]
MLDFGFDKLALIGAVALVVLGPERLPRVARTVGHLLGKAQRYVADVKAEVNRSIELEELQKMKGQFETAVNDVHNSVREGVDSANQTLHSTWSDLSVEGSSSSSDAYGDLTAPTPTYAHPGKNWRLKRGATPLWYKQRQGVRRHAQSGAARVARFRPPRRAS